MDENIINILTGVILGGSLTLTATLIATWVSNRAAEKRLRIQLFNEDKKRTLATLYELINKKYATYDEFKKTLDRFLGGLQSAFLPEKLKAAIRHKFYEIDTFLENSGLAPPPPTDEEIKGWLENLEEQFQQLTEWEKAEEEFKHMLEGLKASIQEQIKKCIKEVE